MINELCEIYKIQNDYGYLELEDILESTSSMVFDRVNKLSMQHLLQGPMKNF